GILGLGLVAQTPGEGPGNGPPSKGDRGDGRKGEGRRGGGNFDPLEMHKKMMERYKETLAMSDEEWKLASPKIEKVMAAQRDARSGGGFPGGFGPGGGGRPGGGPPGRDPEHGGATPLAKATGELRQALEDKATSPDDIGKKLAEVRAARDKAREEL